MSQFPLSDKEEYSRARITLSGKVFVRPREIFGTKRLFHHSWQQWIQSSAYCTPSCQRCGPCFSKNHFNNLELRYYVFVSCCFTRCIIICFFLSKTAAVWTLQSLSLENHLFVQNFRSTISWKESSTNTLQTLVFCVNFFMRWWLTDSKKKAHAAVRYPWALNWQGRCCSAWYLYGLKFQAECFPLTPLQKWLIFLSLDSSLPLPSSWSHKDPRKISSWPNRTRSREFSKKFKVMCERQSS